MLSVLKGKEKFTAPCALLLGGFDGLHLGHMSLLERAKKTGLPVGITSICGGKKGSDLFTFFEREVIFERAGLQFVFEQDFTEEFKNTQAEDYLREIFSRADVRAVFCGEDFRFGKDASGTPELLKKLAPCPVTVAPLLAADGNKISASQIKMRLGSGNVEEANRLLYTGYFLQGEVEHGREAGRRYGFPTLNLSYPAGKFPIADGVYGGFVETPQGKYTAIVNFGARPTFGVEERKVEAHLKDFHGDLYGATVRVFPQRFLRNIKKFDSERELMYQLEKDKKEVFS